MSGQKRIGIVSENAWLAPGHLRPLATLKTALAVLRTRSMELSRCEAIICISY
jgi:hypothetical protein